MLKCSVIGRVPELARRLIRNQLPRKGLRVRVPCPPPPAGCNTTQPAVFFGISASLVLTLLRITSHFGAVMHRFPATLKGLVSLIYSTTTTRQKETAVSRSLSLVYDISPNINRKSRETTTRNCRLEPKKIHTRLETRRSSFAGPDFQVGGFCVWVL